MIKTIAVLGAGTMGHGIAECFAMKGYPVNLYETYEPMRIGVKDTIREELQFLSEHNWMESGEVEASLERITMYGDMETAVKDAD